MVTLPRRPEIVAVGIRLMGSETTPGEIAICCLNCAQPWQQILVDYTQEQLDNIGDNYSCELCGRVIGTWKPVEQMDMHAYKATARQLTTMDPDDLINLLAVVMRNRPDFHPISQPADMVEQYELTYDIKPDSEFPDEAMPVVHSHFVVTVNNKTRLPNLADPDLMRAFDLGDYEERLDEQRSRPA